MSNIIPFRSPRHDVDVSSGHCDRSAEIKSIELRASARNALSLLAGQFEFAMEHAREIERRILDPNKRREFSDQIQKTRYLLDVVHLKILQI